MNIVYLSAFSYLLMSFSVYRLFKTKCSNFFSDRSLRRPKRKRNEQKDLFHHSLCNNFVPAFPSLRAIFVFTISVSFFIQPPFYSIFFAHFPLHFLPFHLFFFIWMFRNSPFTVSLLKIPVANCRAFSANFCQLLVFSEKIVACFRSHVASVIPFVNKRCHF